MADDSSWKVNIGDQKQEQISDEDKNKSEPKSDMLNPNDYVEDTKTGNDMREILTHVKDKVIVIVWFRNEYGHLYLNRNNQETRGALMNIIDKNHRNVVYHEIDLSEYNLNAPTYEDLAKDLGIDLKLLYDAPIALVVYEESGDAFTTDKGSLSLAKMVEKYLVKIEKEKFGIEIDLSNEERIIQGVAKFPVPSVLELEKKYKEEHSNSKPQSEQKESLPAQKQEQKETTATAKPKTSVAPETTKPKKEIKNNRIESKLKNSKPSKKAKVSNVVKPQNQIATIPKPKEISSHMKGPRKPRAAVARNTQVAEIAYPEPDSIQGKRPFSSAYPERIVYPGRIEYQPVPTPVFRNPNDNMYMKRNRKGW
jgi:hypothetical protein